MKNAKIIKAFDGIKPDADAENSVLSKVFNSPKKRKGKVMIKKIIALGAIAAALAICVIGGSGIFNRGNVFDMVVYAEDGSKLADVDYNLGELYISDKVQYAPRSEDGETVQTVRLDFKGDKIKSVNIVARDYNMTLFCIDDNGNPLVDAKSTAVAFTKKDIENGYIIMATAHFLDGTSETKEVKVK